MSSKRFVPPVPNPNISPDTSPEVSPAGTPRADGLPPKSPLYAKPTVGKQSIGQSSQGFKGAQMTSTMPSSSLVPLDSVLDLISCALCGLRFDKEARVPKQMPCSHTYCAACIDARIWQQQSDNVELRCPQQCTQGVLKFRVIDSDRVEPPISTLPTNAFVYDLLDKLPAASATGALPPSTAAGGMSRSGVMSAGGDGFSFVDGYAANQGATQQFPTTPAAAATRGGTMGGGTLTGVSRAGASLDSRPSSASASDVAMCEKHNMEIQNFCSSCEVSVCNMCLKMEGHRGHGLVGPVDAVLLLQGMTANLLKASEEQTEKLTFAMSHCDGIFDQMELESTRVEAAIEQEFGTIIAAFEHRRNLLLKQWRERAAVETDLAEQRKAHMIMLRSQLAASVMMTEGQVAAMEKGLDQGRPVESMLLRDRLYNMLKSTLAESSAPSLFNPPLMTLLPDFIPTTIYPLPSEVGRVEVADVCIGYTTMEGMLLNSKFVSYGVTVEMTLHTFNARKERLDYGGLKWKAALVPIPEESKVEPPPVTVMDIGNGDYLLTFVATVGDWKLCMSTYFQALPPISFSVVRPGQNLGVFGLPGNEAGQLNDPSGCAFDGTAKQLYIADAENHRVQALTVPDGTFVQQFGKNAAVKLSLSTPFDCCLDVMEGLLYIADTWNHRVRVVRIADSTLVKQWGSQGAGQGEFSFPSGILLWKGLVFVADQQNHRVQIFHHADGRFLSQIGTGVRSTEPGGLSLPWFMQQYEDHLYVVDHGNFRVSVFRMEDFAFTRTFGGRGSGRSEFGYITGMAIDPRTGLAYVGDSSNFRVQIFVASTGAYKGWFGGQGVEPGKFAGVRGVAVDSENSVLYVVDNKNNRVQTLACYRTS